MHYLADLHIHSKYSRATSRDLDLEHLAHWACKKGISVVGTGDFTHPAWLSEIKTKLQPAESGLFKLKPQYQVAAMVGLAPALQKEIRFLLEVEISTIYKKGEKTRKIHHLVYAPDLASAERIIGKLSRIGNLKSDGRPILGLDSRNLLEIVLTSGDNCHLIPAHIWTPWFAALGSKSGFDSIDGCYGDLAKHIFAVETGLSSDPEMNWRLSQLDRFRLVSNSDAHSPAKLGREACLFDTELSYQALFGALQTGIGYRGTVEFFPEEGKYHMDGHRACNVRLHPEDTRQHQGKCPSCGGEITVGVMHRIQALADRAKPLKPLTGGEVHSLVPLPEILSEITDKGVGTQTVSRAYEQVIAKLGNEFSILQELPGEEIEKQAGPILREAVERLRKGQVIREAGYDGEYGVIRVFQDGELKLRTSAKSAVQSLQVS